MIEDQKVPVYKFEEGQEDVVPVQRKVMKTMETTESFKVFDVLQYMGKVKKAILDKEAEIEGLRSMLSNYMKELAIIEEQLGIEDLEDEFRKAEAEKATEEDGKKENV